MSNPSNILDQPEPSTQNFRYASRNSNIHPDSLQGITLESLNDSDARSTAQLSSVSSHKDEHPVTLREDFNASTADKPPERKTEVKSGESIQYPPLFIGANLPGERPGIEYSYTDEALVERSLLEEYDMITSRISTPAYRIRVEALFAENEEQLMKSSQPVKSPVPGAMLPPSSPQRLQPLQSRPLRNENTGVYNAFARSSSIEGSSSFKSATSVNSTPWLDRGSPAPSLFSSVPKLANTPTPSPFASSKAPEHPTHSFPFHSFDVPPLEFDDILLLPGAHIRNVVAFTAHWVELDSKNPRIAALSVQVILREIAYAVYCGTTYFIICGPKRRTNIEQYSQAISHILAALPPYCHLLIHLPFAEEDYISSRTGERIPPVDYLSIWDVWNAIRVFNDYAPNLSVMLQVPPKCNFPPVVISRWYAEPVKMLIISSAVFVSNARGYPVLPKATQALLFKFFSKNPFLILSDVYDRDFQGGATSYLLYLRHLVKIRPRPSAIEAYSEGYSDLLQAPLQPLSNNLESSTYEVFERDVVKYTQYETAIFKALQKIQKPRIYVAVVGAGRGPLIDKVLTAANHLGKSVYIYAIEKNESAYIHLVRRLQYEWTDNNVEVVRSDIREWHPKNLQLSLIVSELLGSFGDNELSPECLDAVETLLSPGDGIMIPQSYSAYFTPVMSATLYNSARQFNSKAAGLSNNGTSGRAGGMNGGRDNSSGSMIGENNPALQTPYVVMLNSMDFLSPGQFGKAWVFEHPSSLPRTGTTNLHNTRKVKHTFSVPHQGVMHGIAGYFECRLFDDVMLSTRPDSNEASSKDMLSWFPMWFPLSTPLYITEGSEVDVSMWRLTDGKRVWYEWTVESYYKPGVGALGTALMSPATAAQSPKQRRRVRTGMTELHNGNGQYFAMDL